MTDKVLVRYVTPDPGRDPPSDLGPLFLVPVKQGGTLCLNFTKNTTSNFMKD